MVANDSTGTHVTFFSYVISINVRNSYICRIFYEYFLQLPYRKQFDLIR